MKFLRRISTRQLLLLGASVVALVVGATVIALAATGGGPKPAPKRLPVAVHDALSAAPVQGVQPKYPGKRPPYVSSVPCYKSQIPNLNGSWGAKGPGENAP